MSTRLAIVAADFNKAIVEPMIETATAEIAAAGAALARLVRVAGAYELPLVVDALLARADIDAVVALGHIERGQTLHGEVMGHVVHAALVDLQLHHQKPAGLGIIGPGATEEQAEARKIGSARAAVAAVLRSLEALAGLR
ncbi:MAG: 6,7-dimethyl-8-ribityllumazine synthase [Gemmataceae bacterium]|nr:6,7-dimethyl-8-ribityllumazine synthase [Gemmataceae bacterium]